MLETLFCSSIILFLSTPAYFLCNIKLFVSTQNCFSCNTKFLFWISFRMLCHGNIFLLPSCNKNTILCRKKKNSFLCDSKNLISFFEPHKFFIFNFYIAHADLLGSGSRKKTTFNLSFTHLIVENTNSCSGKQVF